MAHVTGQSRYQTTLFPEVLDELVGADHPVRVIDAFVAGLDLAELGFAKVVAEATGRPAYDPADLLKLYVYGYLNQIRSSRKLERETGRNIEVQWLINRLTPTFKTIADFRRDHVQAIVGVCRAFTRFCRDQFLYGGELLAIDGTKIDAVASRKKVITPKSLAKRAEAIDRKITEYLSAMDEADRQEPAPEVQKTDVAAALKALHTQRQKVQQQAEQLASEDLPQLVLGERDARLMSTPRHGYQVAYNAQIVVDAKHKLIGAFELTNEGNDQRLLHPMAEMGREALGVEQVTVVADAGYSNGEHAELLDAAGVTAIVPRVPTVNPEGKKYFSRDAFHYDAGSDSWLCPAGQTLTCKQVSHTEKVKKYWTSACRGCALKSQCTKAGKRTVVRSFFEDAREAMHQRAMRDPIWMKHRRELVEHPFGIIKWMMGSPRFLLRGLRKAKAELALAVLGFNLKRTINILGVPAMLKALRAQPG